MASAGWDCDIDIGGPTGASSDVQNSKNGDCSKHLQKSRIPAPSLTPIPEPSQKRARFSHDNTCTSPSVNGYVNASEKSTSMSWPFRPDLMQIFRSTFDGKFRGALVENLSTYISRLGGAEESVMSMQKEFKELTECMEHIEKSVEDLKKVISERAALPAPSSGVGQRRALSSQAPRQLLQTSSAICQLPLSESLSDIGSKRLTAAANVGPPCRPISVGSSTCTPNTVVQPTMAIGLTSLFAPVPSSVQCQTDSKSTVSSAAKQVLSVRPVEMIDLTADPSPTTSVMEDLTDTSRVKALISSSVNTTPSVRPGPLHSASAALASASQASKVAWFAAHSIPVTVSRTQRAPVLQTSQLSFRQLQRLPVAPLPPVPYQSNNHFPVQPMPQLTIAEAAEGVCLQWTIGYQSMLFEAATAYEIYSYASSELTAETIFTCLPWKKVGEVAALPLPMACTLTHVQSNNMYYFIVRSIDRYKRYSPWSNVVNAYVG